MSKLTADEIQDMEESDARIGDEALDFEYRL